jgi:hypothetical protein
MEIYMVTFYPEDRWGDVQTGQFHPFFLLHTKLDAVEKQRVETLWKSFMEQRPWCFELLKLKRLSYDEVAQAFIKYLEPYGYFDPSFMGSFALPFKQEEI